ncbi:MAG: GSU2403 family nucleotidyltransferase fold protein, partial [Rhodoferax sp.]
ETAAGVRISEEAMATRDVDMLFDTRKHIAFVTAMKKLDSSLIGVLRKVDPSFEVVEDQLYTARNQDGFEVDIIRRAAKDGDPHLSSLDQVVVATSGEMALMRTVHPLDFARIKLALSKQVGRDPNKSGKDALQSHIVTELANEYLPHLLPAAGESMSAK